MWLLVGELRRVIARPNPKEGSPKFQVQLLAEETLQNGEVREGMFTISTNRPEAFEPYLGEKLIVECSPFARRDGSLGLMFSDSGRVAPATLLDTRA